MRSFVERYSDPWLVIPVGFMFIILFCVVHRTVRDIGAFSGMPRGVLAFCVSALAICGFDQSIVQFIVNKYAVAGAAILLSVASLILVKWKAISTNSDSESQRNPK